MKTCFGHIDSGNNRKSLKKFHKKFHSISHIEEKLLLDTDLAYICENCMSKISHNQSNCIVLIIIQMILRQLNWEKLYHLTQTLTNLLR